tara:strand:+ start:2877 stop:3905 length:1029 start_codon:yes stop_codon:yes gene_type:complete
MAKFLNKKEQVFDLQLTSYAKYLMSIGKFKPAFYAFYDDNVLYDKRHAFTSSSETQSDVDKRIKEDTQYLGSLVLFRDVDETLRNNSDDSIDVYDQQEVTYRSTVPDTDIFKAESAIGDAFLNGGAQTAPAWRTFALQSKITSSAGLNTATNQRIPQVNVEAIYGKKVVENTFNFDPMNLREMNSRTFAFADGNAIQLISRDPVFYTEELNTELLTNNFDLEVFLVLSSSNTDSYKQLERKYFRNEVTNVQDGFMVSEQPKVTPNSQLTTGSVEYYFDVLLDSNVEQKLACRGANKFDKTSYYVDLDFECIPDDRESVFYDIYGSALEPEICEPSEPDVCQD